MTNTEIAIRISYFLVFLKSIPEGTTIQRASRSVKDHLPVEWDAILTAASRMEAKAVFKTHGVERAALVASMYLAPESQLALAKLYN